MSEITLRITVENVAPQQGIGLAPFWVAFHDGSFDIFNEGESASGALESLAEDSITGLERSHIPMAISDNDAANSTEIVVLETGEVLARVVGVFADDLTEADFLSN